MAFGVGVTVWRFALALYSSLKSWIGAACSCHYLSSWIGVLIRLFEIGVKILYFESVLYFGVLDWRHN